MKFVVEGEIKLDFYVYTPTGSKGPFPAIAMAHGFAGTKDHGIELFAKLFLSNSSLVLMHA